MAESGAEAVQKAQQLRPDAITLDVLMPGGGFGALVALRKTPETANIPIIIVSIMDQKQVGFADQPSFRQNRDPPKQGLTFPKRESTILT
jgi:CheY-like chemotaxis protein